MGNNSRILYITHDSHVPSGGVKTIYSHVSLLVKNGYSAFVLHNQTGFKLPWLECDVPVLYSTDKDFQLSPKDIIIIPEDYRAALEALRNINVKKYVFCQNHFYIFKGLQKDNSWADLGIDVFCSSEIISKFLQSVFDYDGVPVIHYAIHLELFKPRKKILQIAYMPRKRPAELDFIRNLFNRLYKQYKEVPWICIDKVSEEKVAQILSESAIFLSTSLYEGFGLPPIEAMACGCIVVGFHGGGGLEYASNENGYWCKEGDIVECVRTLGRVISNIENNDKKVNKVRNQALKKAGEYTFDRQERELLDFWSKVYK
jgi:glycosyltransferase involved in cell wall biosynthesis